MINLYFFHGSALFISNAVEPDIHRHHLVELFISLGNSLKIKKETEYYEAKNFIIDSDEPHRIESNGNSYAIVLLDSEAKITRQLRKLFFNENRVSILPDSLFLSYQEDLKRLFGWDCKIERAKKICNDIVRHFLGEESVDIGTIDPRIEKILDLFNRFPEKKSTIKEIADTFYLSESRLIHLFTAHVGIPIRHYLLWLRLLDAVNIIIKGSSFTDAAYEAGFSDSAHLSSTFKKMFGLKLLEVFKNYNDSRFVQVKTE